MLINYKFLIVLIPSSVVKTGNFGMSKATYFSAGNFSSSNGSETRIAIDGTQMCESYKFVQIVKKFTKQTSHVYYNRFVFGYDSVCGFLFQIPYYCFEYYKLLMIYW